MLNLFHEWGRIFKNIFTSEKQRQKHWIISSGFFYMVAYFCHHLSDNYVDLSDLFVVLSDLYVVKMCKIYKKKVLNVNFTEKSVYVVLIRFRIVNVLLYNTISKNKMCLWNTNINAPDNVQFQRWSRSQGQISWYQLENLVARNTHVQYEISSTHCSKFIRKVKDFKNRSNSKVKVTG